MEVHLELVDYAQKEVLSNLMELYQHDLSEHREMEIGSDGKFGYAYFDHYWLEKGRQAFFIKVAGQLAGFAMLNQHLFLAENKDGNSLAEFFVLRKYRRKGIGTRAAFQIFEQQKGKWELVVWDWNTLGQSFWLAFLATYRGRSFSSQLVQQEEENGILYYFKNQ